MWGDLVTFGLVTEIFNNIKNKITEERICSELKATGFSAIGLFQFRDVKNAISMKEIVDSSASQLSGGRLLATSLQKIVLHINNP